jgi:hypothetical protein
MRERVLLHGRVFKWSAYLRVCMLLRVSVDGYLRRPVHVLYEPHEGPIRAQVLPSGSIYYTRRPNWT